MNNYIKTAVKIPAVSLGNQQHYIYLTYDLREYRRKAIVNSLVNAYDRGYIKNKANDTYYKGCDKQEPVLNVQLSVMLDKNKKDYQHGKSAYLQFNIHDAPILNPETHNRGFPGFCLIKVFYLTGLFSELEEIDSGAHIFVDIAHLCSRILCIGTSIGNCLA